MQICLLKQIKQTVTAKNTDTVGQDYPLKQSDSYCEKYDCCCQDCLLRQIKMRVPKLTSHPTRQTPKAGSVPKGKLTTNHRQNFNFSNNTQRHRNTPNDTELFATAARCVTAEIPPLFLRNEITCRKRRQNFRKRYCKQNNCPW